MIIRRAALRAGVAEGVSPHWLRHAHASHALDHGAPIHLVQATLGHSSVATTSRYLHARPGDSSARFLALKSFPVESRRIDLLVSPAGVMNVLIADKPAKGEHKMSNNTAETKDTAPVSGEPTKKANVGAQKPRVASTKAKSPKKATPARKAPKAQKKAKQAKPAREGSKTSKVLAMLTRPGGASLKEIMKATGWQPHSVRGFISGQLGNKMGLAVTSTKSEDGERSYSVRA
jgi:hypothetical protein